MTEGREAVFSGEFTNGETAEVRLYSVRVNQDKLEILDCQTNLRLDDWPRSSVSLDTSYGGQIRILHAGKPGAALVVSHPAFVNELANAGWMQRPMASTQLFAGLAMLFVACAVGLYFGVTPLSTYLAAKIPASMEDRLGKEIREQVAKDVCVDSRANTVLQDLVGRLKAGEKRKYEVMIVRNEAVNAYATPGNLILINSGFLAKAENPDEVAGVLAHEMEHISRLHAMSSIIRGLILTGAWQITLGDFSGLMVVDPSTLYNLATLKFSREVEEEADAGALKRLDKAGIGRRGFAEFFARMQKDSPSSKVPEFLSSHPSPENRVAKVLRRKNEKSNAPSLNAADWAVLKAACAMGPVSRP